MTDEQKKYLVDILKSVELIRDFTANINSYPDYEKDLKTQSAVERQLGIIGECVNKFERLAPKVTIHNTEKIVGLRNRVIHAYDSIDNTIIWAIIKNHLPKLKSEIEVLLQE
jgi:uncharacterized protein with HEPN domain